MILNLVELLSHVGGHYVSKFDGSPELLIIDPTIQDFFL